ncbi:target of Sbf [Friedmanniomyces endolithicus]|uniref:glucan endo-1,3-beta-D-glucosidase n=2 Tax=Friedmanniomyces endolithicus TaxID=329885 RepID=A0AAN6J8T3_9PEZI|nr:target of Sbf [Friedmanniomyces endolithicus]KAK0269203.1 target of Sbf [Friedmanniomyces endolithicus]KAK0285264.1 target of Sbf [Friedmanniomyces endolithicus]KAK0321097.1 target of Sbf [Friedmanniomyces endolithicus]KAK0907085.1 target of Sbf [Friedmanniomyces endolithicus]
MKYILTATALLAAAVVADKRDLCTDGSTDDNNNWYCQNVTAITYTGVGGSGSYNKVTSMDTSGTCGSSPSAYSGNLSPLDQELSFHFRGPIQLKQFAVYTPSGSSSKARRSAPNERRHAHGHGHAHLHHARDAAVGAEVTATINGVVQSWVNEWSGAASSAPAADPSSAAAAPTAAAPPSPGSASPASSQSSASPSPSSGSSGSISSSSGGWSRQAYYDSSSSTSEGLVFLNHNGGSGSGVFDYNYGNSLSFASSDGLSGASSSQVLKDTTLPSSAEVVIMSDSPCSGDDCSFYREGTVAYHGFDGPSKAFFFEFGMPTTGETAASIYDPVDMPAIWSLNALIPRTLQYGAADCSCWTSGCGEFDLFEVLAPGDQRMKSTLHGNIAGGDSDYFARPSSGTKKAVMVLYENNIHLKMLDDSFEFGSNMDASAITDICGSTLAQTNTVSLFALSG